MTLLDIPTTPIACDNWIGGHPVAGSGAPLKVESPYTAGTLATLHRSTPHDVSAAVEAAARVWPSWRDTPLRERIEPLLKLRSLLLENMDDLANTVAMESGKTPAEARAGIMRGIEVIDFAASLSSSDQGGSLDVSRGVSCQYRRQPLGVVVGITPFNFPAMVPMWMFPLALTVGNAFILKPSEKVPLSANRLASLLRLAGYPDGVFSVVHGDQVTVEALIDHPLTQAVGFVGSSAVAARVYARAAANGKRSLCLGGAKNQLIVAPDADRDLTVRAVVDSFTGCAGQRCMAGSLMILVGGAAQLLEPIQTAAKAIVVGQSMGALIDAAALTRIEAALERAASEGAQLVIDGRRPVVPETYAGGHWLGPTILDQVTSSMECSRAELFGPVLSVIRVDTVDEALAIEHDSPYGNATSVFTSSGAVARHVVERSHSGMIGVNIGVPVPREPFSFGGTKRSRFGHGDLTGPPGIDFWTDQKKITTKWAAQTDASWMS